MRIDDYSFGRITIEGRVYTSDLIIYPGRVECPWRRHRGHQLATGDIEDVLALAPARLIIGTGSSGGLKVSDAVREQIGEHIVEVKVVKTEKAVSLFNSENDRWRIGSGELVRNEPGGPDVVAALHLTC